MLDAQTHKALASNDVRDKLITPAPFNSFIQKEMTLWAKVAQAAGVQPE